MERRRKAIGIGAFRLRCPIPGKEGLCSPRVALPTAFTQKRPGGKEGPGQAEEPGLTPRS